MPYALTDNHILEHPCLVLCCSRPKKHNMHITPLFVITSKHLP